METETRDPLEATLDLTGDAFNDQGNLRNVPAVAQQMPAAGVAEFILAQRAANPRNLGRIMERLKVLANAAGDKWVYGWEVNDRARNRKVWIEGATIKLANDLLREYGNAVLDTRVVDNGPSWTFYSRFVDLESGANRTRPYHLRKSMNIGMKDDQRALDMVFQSGVSRSERNVVCNVLQTLTDFCVEEAKRATIGRIAAKPEDARKWILEQLQAQGVDRKRVEAIYGRSSANWTVTDMAKIYAELRGVMDGFILADEVWPLPDQAEPRQPEGEAGKPRQERKPKAGKEPEQQSGAPKTETPAGTGTPPAEPEKVAESPKVTLHVFDDKKRSLGSMQAPLPKLGDETTMGDSTYKVFEIMEHPGGDGYMVIVSKVLGEAGQQAPAQEQGTQTPGPEAGSGTERPAEAAQRPKRERKAGGSLFGGGK